MSNGQFILILIFLSGTGLLGLGIRAYSKHQHLKLSLKKSKRSQRPEILKAVEPILEDRRSVQLGRRKMRRDDDAAATPLPQPSKKK
jgi:hypothetical protein